MPFLCPNRVCAATREGQYANFSGGNVMNNDTFEGNWKPRAGQVKEKWGQLTDDDLQAISGKRDQLAGRLHEGCGMAKEAAEKQIEEFEKRHATMSISR